MSNISVSFNKKIKPMKPLHGVNNGPQTANFWYDATEWFKKASIPYSRLHDTEWPYGCGEYVDVSCIFKDMDADENLEESYNFTITDDYLKAILDAGTKIIYRLGYSIEHQPDKKYIYKPKDPEKWARICSHIISHYNEGWANGFHWDIRYWEIWNEPDYVEDTDRTWIGSETDFFVFYGIVANILRKNHNDILIGGPAVAHPDGGFAERFVAYAAEYRLPLDFFSWHAYMKNAEEVIRYSQIVRSLLDKNGFTDAESIFDEWNYIPDWSHMEETYRRLSSLEGAAFDAAVFCLLQDTTVDKAAYYDAQLVFEDEFNGLFSAGFTGEHKIANPVIPRKPYFAFMAFGELYRLGFQTGLEINIPGVYGLAAAGEDGKAAMFSNMNDNDECSLEVEFDCNFDKIELYMLDEKNDLKKTAVFTGNKIIFTLPYHAVALVKMKAGQNA